MKLLLLLASTALVCSVHGRWMDSVQAVTGEPERPPHPPPPKSACDFCEHLMKNCEGAKELLKCVIDHHKNHTDEAEPPMEKRQMPPPEDKEHCKMLALEVCFACQKEMEVEEAIWNCGVEPPEKPTPGPEPEPMPEQGPMEGGHGPREHGDPCELCKNGKKDCDGAKDLIKCVRDQFPQKDGKHKGSSSSEGSDEKRQALEMEMDCRLPVLHGCYVCHMMKKVTKIFKKCGLKDFDGEHRPGPMEKRQTPPEGEHDVCSMCQKVMQECNGAEEFVKCVADVFKPDAEGENKPKMADLMVTKRQVEQHMDLNGPHCKLMALGVCHECHKRMMIDKVMEECKPEGPTPSGFPNVVP